MPLAMRNARMRCLAPDLTAYVESDWQLLVLIDSLEQAVFDIFEDDFIEYQAEFDWQSKKRRLLWRLHYSAFLTLSGVAFVNL